VNLAPAADTASAFDIENGVLKLYMGRGGDVVIPDGVTSIGDYAFTMDWITVKSVTMPDSVTSIGNAAFAGCSGLKSITLPNGLTSIGEGAFRGCAQLTDLTIPKSVTSIGADAFVKSRTDKTPLSSLTLHVVAGSTAETYAKNNNIKYVSSGGTGSQDPTPPPTDPDAGEPSGWAVEAVSRAKDLGILPEALQSSYQQNTTRAEFCELAVALIEKLTGKPIEARGVPRHHERQERGYL
jgi:hypothetical protein